MENTCKNLAKIAIDKSRVKEYSNSTYDRIVYLDNGTEFQIEFFNPYKHTIGISVSFDEKSESSQLLVLKPGERVWLDRYLDSPKKFLFSTYTVENSKEAKEAISENGYINIKVYKEKEQTLNFITRSYTYDYNNGWNNWGDTLYYKDATSTTNTRSRSLYNSTVTSSAPTRLGFCDTTLLCNCNCNDFAPSEIKTSLSDNTIETGRIEEGSRSNQEFNTVYNQFESYPLKTEKIKMLPTSQKPVTSSDLAKKYCYNCGRKLKGKFKYCPNCGAKQ